jgi:hypothetical protein
VSETPLTDALQSNPEIAKESCLEKGIRLLKLSRQLERELTAMTAENAALRARCSSCPNIIEAGTRLEQALVAVEKRDKVIAAIPSGVSSGCPPEENWPCHPSDCAECWNNWIKERLK